MRHRKKGRKLNRSSAQRRAMIVNMSAALLEHERIITTPQKAKEVRRYVERLITLARRGRLKDRQMALAMLRHKKIEGMGFSDARVKAVKKLFDDFGPRFKDRNGGYTRIIRLGGARTSEGPVKFQYTLRGQRRVLRLCRNRLGDNAERVILEFVDAASEAGVPPAEIEDDFEEES